jgi:hypothetical protein
MARILVATLFSLGLLGCAEKTNVAAVETAKSSSSTDAFEAAVVQEPAKGSADDAKKVPVGKNVWLEVRGGRRRVLVDAYVCLREGMLEEFLCRRFTKEHEAILAADIDARDLHQALVLAGAEPGAPAEFEPAYKPAHGTHIAIAVQYLKDGKTISHTAQQWVRDVEKKKPMTVDWVFAGSKLVNNPLEPGKPPSYLANQGDVISISNFDCSLLDLPVRSTDSNANLSYEAFTERIPPLETKVLVILEPVAPAKAEKK